MKKMKEEESKVKKVVYRPYSAVRYLLFNVQFQICIGLQFLSLLLARLEIFQCLEREDAREMEKMEENYKIWIDFKEIYRPLKATKIIPRPLIN